jgi:hypothetical protein
MLRFLGIATDYELDDPGSNPGGDEIFRSFRPALGPTHSLLYNGYRVFPGSRSGRGVWVTPTPPSCAEVPTCPIRKGEKPTYLVFRMCISVCVCASLSGRSWL